MKILFLGTQMAMAGAQYVMLNQAEWFHQQGHKVSAVFLFDKQEMESTWQKKYPFSIVNLYSWNGNANLFRNMLNVLFGLARLFRMLRRTKYDVIETLTPHSNLLGIPIAWLARIPVRIASHHGHIEGSSKWLSRVHGMLINSGLASLLIAVSTQVKSMAVNVEGIKEDRIAVILNGIPLLETDTKTKVEAQNIRDELSVKAGSILVLAVGRLDNQKGHTYLLDSIPDILKEFPEVIFAIAGDGFLKQELIDKAVQLSIENNIHFLGNRNDIPALLHAADIYVMPSLWEGLSLALLEAMSSGTPVIVSRVEGMDEVIENGQSGILIPSKDPQKLAKAITELIKNPSQRQSLGQRGKELVANNFSIERMCQEYEREFLKLIRESKNKKKE